VRPLLLTLVCLGIGVGGWSAATRSGLWPLPTPAQAVSSIRDNFDPAIRDEDESRLLAGLRSTTPVGADGMLAEIARENSANPTVSNATQQPSGWSAANIDSLIIALFDVESHGLPSLADVAQQLDDPANLMSDSSRSELATRAYLRYGGWLRYGLLDSETLEPRILSQSEIDGLLNLMNAALSAQTIAQSLAELAPPVDDYPGLRLEMRRLAAYQPVWAGIEEGDDLGPGDEGPRVEQLRARLVAEGLYADSWVAGSPYDTLLQTSVRRFQGRVNLMPNGLMDSDTLRQLNISPEHRMAQLRVNMEQRRWRSRDLGRRHLWINLADFKLQAWEDGELVREHQVMVGREYSSTPEFSEMMSYLVLNPRWGVPGGLAASRFRSIRRNPSVMRTEGYSISNTDGERVALREVDWGRWGRGWPYRLSQAPGPTNPMGEIKFIFPNAHNVYLHDTTAREDFGLTRRDLSAGCIRVQDPMALAAWVLESQADWPRSRIDETAAGNAPRVVWLEEQLPVHIAYWTVVADRDGSVRYLNDLYGRDGRTMLAFTLAFDAPPPLTAHRGGSGTLSAPSLD
jgi:murein L,D-transpeptidase YcbB/YkuD